LEVTMEDGFVKVVSPIDDSPASRADIQAGDLILKIDDTFVKGLSLAEAVELMRGEAGSEVTLSVLSDGDEKPRPVTLKRDRIKVESVKSEVLEPGYGYLRVSQFQNNTG
ncbi:MAG TPA: peptidase S41, partial [Alcanivorax sp.]|nr:peptidase S41 [Alcanivorax sp.]